MLPVQYRLRDRQRISEIFSQGQVLHSPFFVVYFLPNLRNTPHFVFIASKKVGNSVERHRAVRILREAVRLEMPLFSNSDHIFIAKKSLLTLSSRDVQLELQRLFPSSL